MPNQEILRFSDATEVESSSSKICLSFNKEEAQESPLQQVDFFAATPACLSDWFIHTLTQPGDQVCDVFSGRGTTAISAYQLNRDAIANDINPLSEIMIRGRITSTTEEEFRDVLRRALDTTPTPMTAEESAVLGIYFAPQTLQQIWSLRTYLMQNAKDQKGQEAQNCLRFLLTERLLGSGTEFLSVSVPGVGHMNQPEQQAQRNLLYYPVGKPEKNIKSILLRRFSYYQQANIQSTSKIKCLSQEASHLSSISNQSVHLHFTVPPELNTRSYIEEHWLRLWFHGIKQEEFSSKLPNLYTPGEWLQTMTKVMREQHRTLHKNGRSVWVLADTKRISETLWPKLRRAGLDIGWQEETEYLCQIPSKKEKGKLQGSISVRVMQFFKK